MHLSPLSQVQKRLMAWGLAQVNSADDAKIKLHHCPDHSNLAGLKRSLLGKLQGKILEIGPGAGANFSYYPPGIDWLGIEPNPFMHAYLQQEAEHQGFTNLEIQPGTAEAMPIEANSIDAVVSTHVLCSVRNLDQVLQEIKRVLKPGGTFIFIEHVAAPTGTWTRRLQNGIQPVWSNLFDHCHPNRETWKALKRAGFANLSYQHFELAFPIVGPHVAGVAQKLGNS